MFSFNHVAVQAMAFSHLRFLELSVPEIKTEKETVFFSNMATPKAEFRFNGVKDFLVKHEMHIMETLYRI